MQENQTKNLMTRPTRQRSRHAEAGCGVKGARMRHQDFVGTTVRPPVRVNSGDKNRLWPWVPKTPLLVTRGAHGGHSVRRNGQGPLGPNGDLGLMVRVRWDPPGPCSLCIDT